MRKAAVLVVIFLVAVIINDTRAQMVGLHILVLYKLCK